MASDDRSLRDSLEALQVRAKALRARLEDSRRLDVVRAEVQDEVAKLKAEHAAALARIAHVKAEAEEARMRSLQLKRERAEADVLGDLGATVRLGVGAASTLAAGWAGLHWGGVFEGLHTAGAVACTAGACGLVALIYRVAVDLRR